MIAQLLNLGSASFIGHDGLMKIGWNPGEGRTTLPLSHAEFKIAWITWIESGAFAPAAN